jgi:hypothetical protein
VGGTLSDVNTNNTTTFAVNLFHDADGNGIPEGFEAQHALLSASNAADGALDYDGDGLSNYAQYRAGTALGDPLSYLWMIGIGAGADILVRTPRTQAPGPTRRSALG